MYEIVKLVPAGRITTYGHIAKFLGTATSARMVGYAMNASHSDSKSSPQGCKIETEYLQVNIILMV